MIQGMWALIDGHGSRDENGGGIMVKAQRVLIDVVLLEN